MTLNQLFTHLQIRQISKDRLSAEKYIFAQHKSTNSLYINSQKLSNSKSNSTLSPTSLYPGAKLKNLRLLKKASSIASKATSKVKNPSKRKISKDKRTSKYLESKKVAAKPTMSFEPSGTGFHYVNNASSLNYKKETPIHNSVMSYIPINKRNSSMEELKQKSESFGKGHKRSNIEQKASYMTMTTGYANLDFDNSLSPDGKGKTKNTKDKLKNLTTTLGTGASRNATTKALISGGNISKSSKNSNLKSPQYFSQGLSSYYPKKKKYSYLTK
jgi:hypothetical protein